VTAVGVGGFYLLSKRSPAPVATPSEGLSEATPSALPVEGSPAPETAAEATPAPAPASTTASLPPAPALATRPGRTGPLARRAEIPAGAAAAALPGSGAGAPSPAAAPGTAAGGDYSYLDEVPPEGPDGRAAGEALAGKYRAGGSTGYTTGRFNRRERFPKDLSPAERPAAATLGYILVAEEKFHARQGRYGTFVELANAQHLFLDVPLAPNAFQRARYRFTLTLQADGFRAEAMPIGPVGRPLVVDDNGFVRVDRD